MQIQCHSINNLARQSFQLNRINRNQILPHSKISIDFAKKTFSTNIIAMSSDKIKTTSDVKDVAASSSIAGVVHDSAEIDSTVRNVQVQLDDHATVDVKNSLSAVPTFVDNIPDGNDVKLTEKVNGDDVELMDAESAVRNVQTQHGDYRTVDEENIVVLRNCLSPVPTRAVKIDDDDGDQMDLAIELDAEQVVWIEPFSQVRFFSVCFFFVIASIGEA